ncbi:MAG: hypothetical protein GDA56_26190 [Hormoscilla sp. GM7CHS1pb]|nr:hypothetical protein [Hormoscilla sp. GM7CHS1pb]
MKFVAALCDRDLMPTALKVAAVVGSLLFTIDQGGGPGARKVPIDN